MRVVDKIKENFIVLCPGRHGEVVVKLRECVGALKGGCFRYRGRESARRECAEERQANEGSFELPRGFTSFDFHVSAG